MRIAGYVQIMSIFYWTFVKISEFACDSFRDVRFFFASSEATTVVRTDRRRDWPLHAATGQRSCTRSL